MKTIMSTLWKNYLRILEKFPLRTQATTTGLLMGAGDMIAQLAVEQEFYEPIRTLKYFSVGFCLVGPAMRTWYVLLDRIVKGNQQITAVKKVILDQGFFAPVFIVNFIIAVGILRPDSIVEIKRKVKRDFRAIMITNYKVWPAVQIINFYFVPLQHRVLVINLVALFWNTYIAWVAEKKFHLEVPEKHTTCLETISSENV